MQMLDGLLISDAGLRLRGDPRTNNANFYLSSTKLGFLQGVSNIFALHGIHGRIYQTSPGRKMRDLGYADFWRYETKSLSFFTSLYNKWYNNKRKVVPRIATLGPVMLAYWLSGDGSNQLDSHQGKSRRLIFCTECFTIREQLFLIQKLKAVGVYAHLEKTRPNKKGQNQFRIIISRAIDVHIFISKVEPHVPAEFAYKVERPRVMRIREQYFTNRMPEEVKKQHKSNYARIRYRKKKIEILNKQSRYYQLNKDDIRKRRARKND